MSDLDAVTARLDKLERENGRLRNAGVAVLLVVSAILLMGQVPKGKTIKAETMEARTLFIRDTEGRIRAGLEAGLSGGVALVFFEKDMKPRVSLTLADDGPSLYLYEADGVLNPGATLRLTDDGPFLGLFQAEEWRVHLGMREGMPSLSLADAGGEAVLGVEDDGPGLFFKDAGGTDGMQLGLVEEHGPLISLFDTSGMARMLLGVVKKHGPLIRLFDPTGNQRALLQITEDNNPGLSLFDPSGNLRALLALDEKLGGPTLLFTDGRGGQLFRVP